MRVAIVGAALLAPHASQTALAQLTVAGSFASGVAGVGLGVDHTTGEVWAYGSFGTAIQRFSPTGTPLGTIPRPGEGANDVDLEFTSAPLTLGSTLLPAGTPLFINGENGVAEIYAINKSTGAVIATLATQFGVSHVVGGAHHVSRGTIFLVQDGVPGGSAANRVAEINPQTGAIIQSFQITAVAPSFTVNFGDIEVGGNGNLLIASSDETSLGEFTPTGAFVGLHALPGTVGGLSGIGINRATCQVWTISTGGLVSRLNVASSSHPACDRCPADLDDGTGTGTPDEGVDINDLLFFLGAFEQGDLDADLDDGNGGGTRDGGVDINDLLFFLAHFEVGC